MPQMANITVKAANGTTDVVFTAMNPASGNNTSATWHATALGASPAARPRLDVSATDNGSKTARRVDGRFVYPYAVLDAQSVPVIRDTASFRFTGTIPVAIPDTAAGEYAALIGNLVASALLKEIVKTGYSAT